MPGGSTVQPRYWGAGLQTRSGGPLGHGDCSNEQEASDYDGDNTIFDLAAVLQSLYCSREPKTGAVTSKNLRTPIGIEESPDLSNEFCRLIVSNNTVDCGVMNHRGGAA
jgi:hypothetical protein